LLFEDKLIEIWTFPLKHRIPTNGFLIKEKQKERHLDGEKFKRDGLSLTCIPKFKNGEDVVLDDGTILAAADYTFPPNKPKSYAYCSDTIYTESIIPFIEHVSCLYHEATFLHDKLDRAKVTFHTTALQAGILAEKAKINRLLLGHLSARYENGIAHLKEAKSQFFNTEVVEDGTTYHI
jgi:ribonuclease Z